MTHLPVHYLKNNYFLIRAQEVSQLDVAMILHVRFFGVLGLIYSPIATKYTGPLNLLIIFVLLSIYLLSR